MSNEKIIREVYEVLESRRDNPIDSYTSNIMKDSDKRAEDKIFRPMWIYILLSFLFYIPVAVFAGLVPMLGMLMLPKTICYILMIVAFLRKSKE